MFLYSSYGCLSHHSEPSPWLVVLLNHLRKAHSETFANMTRVSGDDTLTLD